MPKVANNKYLRALPTATPAPSATSGTSFGALRQGENQPARERTHSSHSFVPKRLHIPPTLSGYPRRRPDLQSADSSSTIHFAFSGSETQMAKSEARPFPNSFWVLGFFSVFIETRFEPKNEEEKYDEKHSIN